MDIFTNNGKHDMYSAGPVIRKQDFQIARRFLKTDALLGEGKPSPRPSPRALRAKKGIEYE